MFKNKFNIFIFISYLLNVAGGIWHLLNVLQNIMSYLSSPVIILLSIFAFIVAKKDILSDRSTSFVFFSILVIIFTFLVELLGVKTGKIFGIYEYGIKLIPQIFETPISIGFAWLLVLLFSTSFVNSFGFVRNNLQLSAIMIGLTMTAFDFLMEPAATKLNYWNWVNNTIPFQNYLAWFIIGSFIAYVGLKFNIINNIKSKYLIHLAISQILYFTLVLLK